MPPPAESTPWLYRIAAAAAAIPLILTVFGAGFWPMLIVALWVLSARAVGGTIQAVSSPSLAELPPWGRGILTTAFGAGVLAWLSWLVALLGLMPRFLLPALLVGPGFLYLIPLLFRAVANWRGAFRIHPAGAHWLALVGVFWASFLYLCAAVPPIDHDSLVYHLALPQQWLLNGRAEFLPSLHYSAFPLASESLFAGALAIGDGVAAKAVAWSFGLLFGASVMLLTWRLLPANRRASLGPLYAGILALSGPAAAIGSTLTYSDLWLAAFLLFSLEALLRRSETKDPASVWHAGFFAGVALSSKYTALVLFPALALAAAWLVLRGRERWATVLRDAGIASGTALILGSPTLLRNLFAAGDPLYPLLTRWLGSEVWDAVSMSAVSDAYHGARTLEGLLLLPLDVLFAPARFGAAANPGPLLLFALLPAVGALLFFWSEGHQRRLAAWIALVSMLLLWWLTAMNGRYFLAGTGILCALALCSISATRNPAVRFLALLLILPGFLLGMVQTFQFQSRVVLDPASAWMFRYQRTETYNAERRPHLEFYERARHLLPGDAVVLFVGEARAYDIGRRAIWGSAYDPSPLCLYFREVAGPEEPIHGPVAYRLAALLRARGITHILVGAAEADRLDRDYGHFRELGDRRWEDLLQAMDAKPPVFSDDRLGYYLIELPDHESVRLTTERRVIPSGS